MACDFQYPIFQPFSRYIQSKGAHIFHYHADLRAWLNDQLDLVRVDSVGVDLHQSGDSANAEGWRLAAREIEPLVRAKVAALLSDPINLIGRSGGELPSTDEFKDSVARATALTETLSGPRAQSARLLRELVAQVQIARNKVTVLIDSAKLASRLQIPAVGEALKLEISASLKRSGMAMRLINHNGTRPLPAVDQTLIKRIVQARSWWGELNANTQLTLTDIARREGITSGYVVRIVRLAFLSPAMLKSIIEGTAPAHLTLKRLLAPDAIAALWENKFAADSLSAPPSASH